MLAGSHAHVLKKSGLYYCKCPCITSIQQYQVRLAISGQKHEASLRIPILHRADGAAAALQEAMVTTPKWRHCSSVMHPQPAGICHRFQTHCMSFTCHCAAAPLWPPQWCRHYMKYIKPVLTLLGAGWCISTSVKSGQLLYFPSHVLFVSFQKHLFRKIYSCVFSSEETPLKYLWLNIWLFLVSRLIEFHYFSRKERNSISKNVPNCLCVLL